MAQLNCSMNMDDATDSSSDDGAAVFVQAVVQLQMDIFMATNASSCFNQLFFETETGYETDFSVSINFGKIERLNNLISGHASIFRITTGFTLSEWERFTHAL